MSVLTSCRRKLRHCALRRPDYDIDVVLFEDLINPAFSCNIVPMRYTFGHLLGSKIARFSAFEDILAWVTWVSSATGAVEFRDLQEAHEVVIPSRRAFC